MSLKKSGEMKLDIYNEADAATIARYLSNEMDVDEHVAFENRIKDSDETMLMVKEMKNQWKMFDNYQPDADPPDTAKAWSKLHKRLSDEQLLPSTHKYSNLISSRNMMRIAAAVLVLAAIGIGILLGVQQKKQPQMVNILTGNESNTLIKTLADGSIIYIAGNSNFSYPAEFESHSRTVELKGEAYFDISSNPEKPFIIETEEAKVEVLGTAFNLKTSDGSSFKLQVTRGKVRVTLKNNPSSPEYVKAGEMITTSGNSFVKAKSDPAQPVDWFIHSMKFRDEKLQQIINVLNRNFHTTFAVANSEIGNRRLTVTFSDETPETMAELMCLTLNLKCRKTNGSTLLLEPNQDSKAN